MSLRSPQEPSDSFALPTERKPAAPVERKPAPVVIEQKPESWRPYGRPGIEVNGDGQLRTTENKAARVTRTEDDQA